MAASSPFTEGVSAALARLGGEGLGAFDPILDPRGAAFALEAVTPGATVLLRLCEENGPERGNFGPVPHMPSWVAITRGSSKLRVVPLAGGGAAPEELSAKQVRIESEAVTCCDVATCDAKKTRVRAVLVAARGDVERRFVLADQRAADASQAASAAVRTGARLADALGIGLISNESSDGAAPIAAPRASAGALELARLSLAAEGDRTVLRDHGRAGPRASAPKHRWIGVGFLLAALATWALFAQDTAGGGSSGTTVGFAALAVLFSLSAYAFLGVARFAARYTGESAPLLAVFPGRVAPFPWVARDGAVERRHDGRYGTAIPTDEISGLRCLEKDGRASLILDGEHGAIELASDLHPAAAELLADALLRVIREAAHPAARATGKGKLRNLRKSA